jgi:expansin
VTARPSSPRWLATGGAVVVAGTAAIAVLLRSPACVPPPTPSPHKGKATYYEAGTKGSCSFARPADDLYVALGPNQYATAAACGGYLEVTGPKGKVRVKVFDACPGCGTGRLDLSRTAFKRIGGNETKGVIPIAYRAVPNPRTPGPLSITFVEGTPYPWAVVIDNHANPLKSVKAKGPGGSWMTATRTDDNAWATNRDVGNGPFSVRMTDIYGHAGTATNIKLIPNKRHATTVDLAAKSCD